MPELHHWQHFKTIKQFLPKFRTELRRSLFRLILIKINMPAKAKIPRLMNMGIPGI